MSRTTASEVSSRSVSPEARTKKRKRSEPTAEELEIDVTAPEPPSKKALRKAKKSKSAPIISAPNKHAGVKHSNAVEQTLLAKESPSKAPSQSRNDDDEKAKPSKRSDYGVWIGNLPWSMTKENLRTFFTTDTDITDEAITRIHMPAPSGKPAGAGIQNNKGFAYVDLATEKALTAALGLSETLMTGRRLLIKDAKSFEGRPDKTKEAAKPDSQSGKPPNKRVFVGNLGFDITKEDLQEHLSRCGNVLDVHLATFEDSGKCKGYGWVEFDTIEAGEAAVRGWVNMEQKQEDGDIDEDVDEAKITKQDKAKKKPRPRKWWVNKLRGRPLRTEFAEDKSVRYKKRFGKNAPTQKETTTEYTNTALDQQPSLTDTAPVTAPSTPRIEKERPRPKKFDARTIPSGQAHAAAPRLQGAIVAGQGKKTVLG